MPLASATNVMNRTTTALSYDKNYALPCYEKGKDANKNIIQRIWNTTLGYLKEAEGVKNTCKVVATVVDWAKLKNPHLDTRIKSVGAVAKDGKSILTILEFPKIFNDAVKSIHDFFHSDKAKQNRWMAGRDAAVNTIYLTSPVSEAVKFASSTNIIPFSKLALRNNNLIGSGGLAIGTINGACKDINTIVKDTKKINAANTEANEKKIVTKQRVNTVLSLFRNGSYVALGISSIIAALGVAAVAPWLILGASTSALGFTIGCYFHKKLADVPDRSKE